MRFIFVLFGGLINRIRGGWFELGFLNKPINHILFGITFGHSLVQMIILGCSMWLGTCFGWSSYIEGINKKRVMPRGDLELLDWLFLRGKSRPVFRNMLALSCRGLVWSVSLATGFILCGHVSLIIMLSGLAMGYIYVVSYEIAQLCGSRGLGWQVGELIFGSYLWLICYFY